ncbi:hypothetical protein [Wukongibacter sp. M2B1]|uniref:hypothetical protein n=1 Tax=Wukongibacter sp. M2B1 TaxID=3088895 RepID=UPI003D7ACA47
MNLNIGCIENYLINDGYYFFYETCDENMIPASFNNPKDYNVFILVKEKELPNNGETALVLPKDNFACIRKVLFT